MIDSGENEKDESLPPANVQTVRRGGVSAEPINEEELGDYVKKVNIVIHHKS